MKHCTKMVLVFLLFVSGAVASGSAMAQRHGRGHGWGPHWGISIGLPLYWPGYYPGYYPYAWPAYAYPGPVVPPTTYIEQVVPQAAPAQPQGDWFYCAGSKSYYPYVRECPAGWQRVPSTPPR